MKKILFVTNNMLGGGAERVLLTLLNSLDRTKFSIDLILIKNKGIRLDEIAKDISVKYIYDADGGDLPKDPSQVKEIYKNTVRQKYDIEIAFLEGAPTYFVSQSDNPHSKKYAWVHVDLNAYHWTCSYYNSLEDERTAYLKFDKIIFVSQSNLQAFRKEFGIDENLHVLFNPIDAQSILSQSDAYKIHEERFMFCYVSSISKRKGQDKIIRAIKQLSDDGYDCCLYLVGDGEFADECKRLCEELSITDRVIFTGYEKNPFPYIKAADVFVHASSSEGFPVVLCESLILNTPVIATECNGSIDVLENGAYGLMTEISVDGIYAAMKNMLQNPELCNRYSETGKAWTKKYFRNNNYKAIEALFEE